MNVNFLTAVAFLCALGKLIRTNRHESRINVVVGAALFCYFRKCDATGLCLYAHTSVFRDRKQKVKSNFFFASVVFFSYLLQHRWPQLLREGLRKKCVIQLVMS